MRHFKQWARKWNCIFFHRKEITNEVPNHKDLGVFLWDFGRYEGCKKCNIWRKV